LTGKKVCKEALQKIYGLPPRPDVPLLGIISRLADQKGFDLLTEVFDYLMAFDVQFVLLGTGDPEYHRVFEALAKRYPEQCGVKLRFDNALALQIEAGADFFLCLRSTALLDEPDVQPEIWNDSRGSRHGRTGGHRAGIRSQNGAGQWIPLSKT
jgi:hypothetical protein